MYIKNKKDYLDRNIQKIEEAVQDDLALLLEFGPDYFETRELFDLLSDLKYQTEKVSYLKKILLATAFVVLVCLAAAIYALFHERLFFGYTFLIFIPLFTGMSGFLLYKFQKRFSTYRYTSYLRIMIEKEIETRRSTTIF